MIVSYDIALWLSLLATDKSASQITDSIEGFQLILLNRSTHYLVKFKEESSSNCKISSKYIAIAHNNTYSHMGRPYAYRTSNWPIRLQDIPYTYETSHTCISQCMHKGRNTYIRVHIHNLISALAAWYMFAKKRDQII